VINSIVPAARVEVVEIMVRRTRIAALLTLAMINVFTLTAGLAVARMLPARLAALRVPAVAAAPVTGRDAVLGTGTQDGPLPTASGLRKALAGPLSAAALGPRVSALVADPATGRILLSEHGTRLMTPASTTKLATGLAALAVLGPDARFTTRVVRGATPDTIILVGGGDPTLAVNPFPAQDYPQPATLASLAASTARALSAQGRRTVVLGYDTSLYTGPQMASGWPAAYVSAGDVTPIVSLEVDQGRLTSGGQPEDSDDPYNLHPRSSDPAGQAAASFAALLTADGIRVTADPAPHDAATQNAAQIASVTSPPLSAIMAQMLGESNNVIAENLARQVALTTSEPASFSGAAQAVIDELGRLGVSTGIRLVDGSGLSPQDAIAPAALVKVLELATDRPAYRALLAGLPVAGFSGTLSAGESVFAGISGAALGSVRAKTGNLGTVTSLAGLAYDKSGRVLVFAIMADQVPSAGLLKEAAKAIDAAASALAGCGCRLRALPAARTVGL
jgi:D-alanyl-D-alanine carboxypeptidase/D-alanyl-D-alanine-endopeptidase (penicillin-binding protein 4)